MVIRCCSRFGEGWQVSGSRKRARFNQAFGVRMGGGGNDGFVSDGARESR